MTVYSCNSQTHEVEAGGSKSIWQVPGQTRATETLSQTNKQKEQKNLKLALWWIAKSILAWDI